MNDEDKKKNPLKPHKTDLSASRALRANFPARTRTLFHSEKHLTRDGIEMGVLEDGLPYLSQKGLAAMLGINRSTLQDFTAAWSKQASTKQIENFNKILKNYEYSEDELYIEAEVNGTILYAYTEPVCMALLEYYTSITPKEQAKKSMRILVRDSFSRFVYTAVGYSPEQKQLDVWRDFHTRIDLVASNVPVGCFCVFMETAGLVVPLIKEGIIVNNRTVPDGSIGIHWSNYWRENKLDQIYGEPIKYLHYYPENYPQSASNPQKVWAYPDDALPLFRKWLREVYISEKLHTYMMKIIKEGKIDKKIGMKALEAVMPIAITTDSKDADN